MSFNNMTDFDLAVIGEGVSGLACAGHAARLGLSVATYESTVFGGLVLNIGSLHGHGEGQSGIELAAALSEANAALGVQSVMAEVLRVGWNGEAFELDTADGTQTARSVVLATGARLRPLDLPGVERFEGRGLSHCADCDGPLLAGQPVTVVGGGDAAFMQAALLAPIASEVTLLMRSPHPRARQAFVDAVAAEKRIRVMAGTVLQEVLGDSKVEGVVVSTVGQTQTLACAGVFVYAGLIPNSELAAGVARLDGLDFIVTDGQCRASVAGLYAIGAVRSGYSGRLSDAVVEARQVAEQVAARLRAISTLAAV